MVTRTLSTHGRSKQNVDVVSARSVFGFLGLGSGLGLWVQVVFVFRCFNPPFTQRFL